MLAKLAVSVTANVSLSDSASRTNPAVFTSGRSYFPYKLLQLLKVNTASPMARRVYNLLFIILILISYWCHSTLRMGVLLKLSGCFRILFIFKCNRRKALLQPLEDGKQGRNNKRSEEHTSELQSR